MSSKRKKSPGENGVCGSTKYDVDREFSKSHPRKYFLIRVVEALAMP